MDSSLRVLTSFAVSFISTALIFKQFNLSEWETHAFLGGAILFCVIAVIIGKTFNLNLIGAMVASSIFTGFIMLFVLPVFGAFLLIFGFACLILAVAYESEQSTYWG